MTSAGTENDVPTPEQLARYRDYVQSEIDGAYYYRTLGALEENTDLRDLYERLAATEERHLALWRQQLADAGEEIPDAKPSRRARLLMWLARRLGTDTVLPVIKAMEGGADEMYRHEPVAAAAGLPADERSHERVFTAMQRTRGTWPPGPVIGRIESRHRALGGGNALRAAVLGANDGLVSNLALVMGFAGADLGQATIILAGLAGLVAGASSMALGEWISVTSAREAGMARLAEEAEEIALMPEAEQEEIALIYQAKGLSREQAEEVAAQIMADADTALATMAREELGIVPEDLGSPWIAAFASFVLFGAGALIPVIPFFLGTSLTLVIASVVLSAAGLFVLGTSITLFTGRSPWYAGSRQVVLGLAAAAVTFGIGLFIGDVAGI